MSFLSPLFLWGLPLVAVPVLIHLFGKRQRQRVRWGAMGFLLGSATPRRRPLRLRDLLLMLLRAAILLALVCALSRPLLSSGRFGATGPRDVILVLDNSMSTARRVGTGTVFDREVNEAVRLIGQLNSTDRLRFWLASPRPEWLTDTPLAADRSATRALVSRLRELKPNDGSADLLECIQEAIKAPAAGKEMDRFVTVITDGQAYGWRATAPGAWSATRVLAEKASPPVALRVVLAGEPLSPAANLAVEKITASRAVVGIGQPVTLDASVKNTGAVATDSTVLIWSAGDKSVGVSTVPALEPGASTTIDISQPFAAPGLFEISSHLGKADDLPLDDAAHFLLEVTEAVPILLVEGEPQSDPLQSDTRYFLAALGYHGGTASPAASVFRPKVVGYQQLGKEDLARFRCVVLANIPHLSAETVQKLGQYVTSGGGLWMALGEQTDVTAFNHVLVETGTGLSPLALTQPIGDAGDREKFTAVSPPAPEHPATALLADTKRLDIDRAKIYRRHQFEADNGSAVAVLLRVQGGAALAIEKDLGRGRVIVQAVPLGLAWSNLPLCHAYVVLVHEWLWYLTEPGLVKRNLRPGELLQVSQSLESGAGSASLALPDGQLAQLVGQEESGRILFRYRKTLLSGEYRLTIPGGPPGTRPEQFLVGRDPEESNLTPLSTQDTKTLTEFGGLAFGPNAFSQPPSQHVTAVPKPLAQSLLVALLVFMAVEAIVAFLATHLRRAPAPAVVMKNAP